MSRRADGFTLTELLVTVVIVLVLAGTAYGVSMRVRESARETRCLGNLRQWGVALNLYMADHDGKIARRGQGVQPLGQIEPDDYWFNSLPPYLGLRPYKEQYAAGTQPRAGDPHVLICPSAKRGRDDPNKHFLCYAMNMYLSPTIRPEPHRAAELDDIHQLAFMADAPGPYSSTVPSRNGYSVSARHSGKANVVFVDGHVQSFPGDYLGCGTGEKTRTDIRWQTLSAGTNQNPVP